MFCCCILVFNSDLFGFGWCTIYYLKPEVKFKKSCNFWHFCHFYTQNCLNFFPKKWRNTENSWILLTLVNVVHFKVVLHILNSIELRVYFSLFTTGWPLIVKTLFDAVFSAVRWRKWASLGVYMKALLISFQTKYNIIWYLAHN